MWSSLKYIYFFLSFKLNNLFIVMRTLGEFWLNKKNIGVQDYRVVKKKLTWYGGRTSVPPDTPKCGFACELCQKPRESYSMLTFIIHFLGRSYLDKNTLEPFDSEPFNLSSKEISQQSIYISIEIFLQKSIFYLFIQLPPKGKKKSKK